MLRKVAIGVGIAAALLVLVAILFPVFVQAKHGSGRMKIVNGVVLDGGGRPVAHEKLHISGDGGKDLGEIETDSHGEFHLDPTLQVRRIDGYERRGYRKPVTTAPVTFIFRVEGAVEYKLPDKEFSVERIKRLRYAMLVDELDIPDRVGWHVVDKTGRDVNVDCDSRGIFKFPAAMKEPTVPEAKVVGYIKASEKEVYAVYQGHYMD